MNQETQTPRSDAAQIQGNIKNQSDKDNQWPWSAIDRGYEFARELELELNAANEKINNNPWCAACKETDCCVSFDGTCAMVRKYHLAEKNGKLAHDNGIAAMKYREQRVILQAALEEIATGAPT